MLILMILMNMMMATMTMMRRGCLLISKDRYESLVPLQKDKDYDENLVPLQKDKDYDFTAAPLLKLQGCWMDSRWANDSSEMIQQNRCKSCAVLNFSWLL